MLERRSPDLTRVANDGEARRVELTIACADSDAMERVAGAGDIIRIGGTDMQIMHNGLLVEMDGYGGPWETEIIRALRGVHEPQEEPAFDAVIRRLATRPGPHRMIEFGSYWAYYSMWFASRLPDALVLAMEPDPAHLEVGRRNAAANDLSGSIEFLWGAVGSRPGEAIDFQNESDGKTIRVQQYDLASLMDRQGWDTVDLVLIDIQGPETMLLERARPLLESGAVGFVVVSTHHVSISGDALTHQKVLEILRDTGGHVVAEHSVQESHSGDGLIVVAYDPQDADLTVSVSFARSRDSLFGELEWDLESACEATRRAVERIHELNKRNQQLSDRLASIESSAAWRLARPLRAIYRRVFRRPRSQIRT